MGKATISKLVCSISFRGSNTASNGKLPTQENQKLPNLPRRWARVHHLVSFFLKSTGLGVLATTIRGFRKDFVEPKKIAIQKHRGAAALKSLIHLLPVGLAVLEIVWNWRGRYIGASFDQQSYYQFAAKAHEMLIQASLSAILLSCILTELAAKGLPFGAFLSGLQFTQVSYLWSTELWSSVFTKDFQLSRKLSFLTITVSCALIAATSGPSSATLLIPRQVLWPLSPMHLLINGASQDIWPQHITTEGISPECIYVTDNPLPSTCPAADANKIGQLLLDLQPVAPINSSFRQVVWRAASAGEPFLRDCVLTSCPEDSNQLCGSCPQDIIANAAYDKILKWIEKFSNSSSATWIDIFFDIDTNYFQPYTIVHCLSDTIESSQDSRLLRFPQLLNNNRSYSERDRLLGVPGLRKGSYLATHGNSSEFDLSWVDLPIGIFSESTIGAVLVHPQKPGDQTAQNITVCTIGAGWGSSSMHADFTTGNIFYSTISGVPDYYKTARVPKVGVTVSVPDYTIGQSYVYPQARVSISRDWAELLNPYVLLDGGDNTTIINEYISSNAMELSDISIAEILNIMFMYGLSKVGAGLTSEVSTPDTGSCKDCYTFDIRPALSAWAYKQDGTSVKLSIFVMFFYCLLAFGHTIYLLSTGLTSGAWDTAAEVLALAMNSTPTKYLQNTCAGIFSVQTFKTKVRTMVRDSGTGTDEHVELVFGDVPDPKFSLLVENEEYGTLGLKED